MFRIDIEYITYNDPNTGRVCMHYVLLDKSSAKQIVMLSHVNLFLRDRTVASKATSRRYAYLISMFYNFLSLEKKLSQIAISNYHVIASNKLIRKWQVNRQIQRVKTQSIRPSSQTIFDDAKLLLNFFKWLIDRGYPTNVVVETKTWVAKVKSNHLLNYITKKARVSIDSKNIEVLDKQRRQKRIKSLITNDEINSLLLAYPDPVYASLFKFSLATAMRPMELCAFPHLGKGHNKHIMPYSQMSLSNSVVVDYLVNGKGNKDRTIKINVNDLRDLEEQYIKPFYFNRAAKYREIFDEDCPPSILFLTEDGLPVTSQKISTRTNYAKKLIIAKNPEFREAISFYDARHWWPTMFLIKFFKEKLLTSSADALYVAAAEVLKNQMGHEDISTTFKFYIDKARLVLIAHQGLVHELVTEPKETVENFVRNL